MPFDRAKFAQWRCYWPFGGGMYTDLFVHQLTHLIAAMGVRFPRRVVGGGGLYLEYDGRDVPDVATVVADYDEGCQVIVTATMCNDHRSRRSSAATPARSSSTGDGFDVLPQKLANRPGPSERRSRPRAAEHVTAHAARRLDTRALWEHFLECIRSRNPETLCPAETGYAAIATVNMGVAVVPRGQGLYFDKETGKVSEADESWAKKWEKMSQERASRTRSWAGTPATTARLLDPPDYQKLEGDWVDGRDRRRGLSPDLVPSRNSAADRSSTAAASVDASYDESGSRRGFPSLRGLRPPAPLVALLVPLRRPVRRRSR